MALVVFRSRAAAQIVMLADTAQRIFELLKREPAPRGVITQAQLPEAIARLEQAMHDDRARQPQAGQDSGEDASPAQEEPREPCVALAQRIFPVLEMLRAAHDRKADVTWGV